MDNNCAACHYVYQIPKDSNGWVSSGPRFIRIDFIGRLIKNNDSMNSIDEFYELSICPKCKTVKFVG